ncbi:MAG: ArsR/SmtB family transcription factor [Akkermansiaceae bacterium]
MSDPTQFFKTLSDSTRWRIVRLVSEHTLCICELADILGMPQSSVSSHVQIIRKAELLDSERVGKWSYFKIKPAYLPLLEGILEHFPEDETFAEDRIKTLSRLSDRESSCCPRPERLS